ncbi:hypothetical protein [Streptomyces sp. NPDC006335]|uniref:hypothetical protein n=1 Tax=Streptomyces sp. NPDC006335 TaxID=3156895 RepID=UPI0033A35CE4
MTAALTEYTEYDDVRRSRTARGDAGRRSVDVARAPAADAVEATGHGHPGTTPAHPEHGHTPGLEKTFDHTIRHAIRVLACDGDPQQGVSHEASSPAGHRQPGNLVVLRDDHPIPSEDAPSAAVPKDVLVRCRACGCQVQQVDRTACGTCTEDAEALHRALSAARRETSRSLLPCLEWFDEQDRRGGRR